LWCWAWREVERVDVQRLGAPSTQELGTVKFESVAIVTTDGCKIAVSELTLAELMRDTIMRMKERV